MLAKRCYGASGEDKASSSLETTDGVPHAAAAVDQDSTLIAVIEMSRSTWLVASIVPGINRQPLKKLAADETALLQRWIAGGTKRPRQAARSIGSRWPTKPAGTASGWRGGCGDAASRLM